MSSWGMDDGSTLTGDGDFTGSPAANTFTSNHSDTVWDDELEVGDCIIGADGLLYRIELKQVTLLPHWIETMREQMLLTKQLLK